MSRNIIVFGASNQIGHFLVPQLLKNAYSVHVVSRQQNSMAQQTGLITHCGDLNNLESLSSLPDCQHMIYSAPLQYLAPLMKRNYFPSLSRIIVFSSTSRFTKEDSSSIADREVAAILAQSEQKIIDACQNRNISWTIFRPTLVYGCGKDKNVTTIKQFIERFHFFPLIGKAQGLRQPVHAEDLASACIKAMDCAEAYNKAYNLTGGQTLSYRAMVDKIFLDLNKKRHYLSIPAWIFRGGIKLISCIPKYKYLTPAMADRMNQDLVFDSSAAQNDFDYKARSFES